MHHGDQSADGGCVLAELLPHAGDRVARARRHDRTPEAADDIAYLTDLGWPERGPLADQLRLDREALSKIASAGGGQYFELDRDEDRRIANTIIDAGRRRASPSGVVEQAQELYWWLLGAAAIFATAGLVFLRERVELAILVTGVVVAVASVWRVLE